MYGQDPDLIREVLKVFHLSWPQILFVANHGTTTKKLGDWQAQAEEEHEARQEEFAVQSQRKGWGGQTRRPFEVAGQPVRFSKAQLVKFYRAYERVIWESAIEFISSTESGHPSGFEALGRCLGNREDIQSLSDVAAAAASWAIAEACQMVFSDYDGNKDAEPGSSDDYAQFRDIWEPAVEHHQVHTDIDYEESIMRRLKSGN
jgi:hypothetical protein